MHYSYGPKRLAQKKQILLTVQNDIVCGPLHSKSTINIYKGHSHVIYLRTFNKITHHHSLDYFGLTERQFEFINDVQSYTHIRTDLPKANSMRANESVWVTFKHWRVCHLRLTFPNSFMCMCVRMAFVLLNHKQQNKVLATNFNQLYSSKPYYSLILYFLCKNLSREFVYSF